MFFVFFLLKMRDSDANGLRRTTLVFSFSYIIDDQRRLAVANYLLARRGEQGYHSRGVKDYTARISVRSDKTLMQRDVTLAESFQKRVDTNTAGLRERDS